MPSGAKINWQITARKGNRLSIKPDGIPFIFMGKKTYMCHHGRDKGITAKRKWKEKKDRHTVRLIVFKDTNRANMEKIGVET